MFFDTFQVEVFYSAVSSALALFATGNTTGIVLYSGYAITHSVPIFGFFSLFYASVNVDIVVTIFRNI